MGIPEHGTLSRYTYRKNPCRCEKCRAVRAAYARQRRREVKKVIDDLKANPCSDCGGSFHSAAMTWDHLPEHEKFGDVSGLIKRGIRRVLEEIAKCELVCANCHAVRSFNRNQSGRLL